MSSYFYEMTTRLLQAQELAANLWIQLEQERQRHQQTREQLALAEIERDAWHHQADLDLHRAKAAALDAERKQRPWS